MKKALHKWIEKDSEKLMETVVKGLLEGEVTKKP
jgi:hypothetical protein